MLVYGTAIFVMKRIKGDESIAKSKLSYLMYFLGLTNLLFGWAHHIYIVPNAPWIRYLAYIISMTELLILGKIIWNFKNSLSEASKDFHIMHYKFIVTSEVWILLNLTFALMISIPAIKIFTHGTHITIVHAMGSTIGINTMILLASCFVLIKDITKHQYNKMQSKIILYGFWFTNIYLMLFWLSLIFAGVMKGYLSIEDKINFQVIMHNISLHLTVFAISGIGIFAGLLMITIPTLKAAKNFLYNH